MLIFGTILIVAAFAIVLGIPAVALYKRHQYIKGGRK